MPAVAFAAYPKGAQMNLEYYQTKHVPWVFGLWQPYAKAYRLLQGGADSPYEVIIEIDLDHADDLAKANAQLTPEQAQAMQDDLANYSQKPPVFWVTDVVKTGSNSSTA
ncbi:hypothetical protein PG999_001775 [Apiospora kogelbergensis]|uniref:EthD domain-containing protein n=1 Tax=Apiospora kogelbergensis TaxID=1337665 RepID=A0AAW0R6J9_9PEZI